MSEGDQIKNQASTSLEEQEKNKLKVIVMIFQIFQILQKARNLSLHKDFYFQSQYQQ